MQTIKNIYVIGPGPSSSHTIGPCNATKDFISRLRKNNIKFDNIRVVLYGSLALTGEGHLTDKIIIDTFHEFGIENAFIDFNFTVKNLKHPNTIDFVAYKNDEDVFNVVYYSVGGGEITTSLLRNREVDNTYNFNNFNEIKNYMKEHKITDLVDFVNGFEDKNIDNFLANILEKMFTCVEEGLQKSGDLPGKLSLKRVAKKIFEEALTLDSCSEQKLMLVTSFAYAVAEENASGSIIVTAPTCGSSGVLPSILYYEYKYGESSKTQLINALKVAGLFGTIIRQNASISGAVLGCQAEIGTASVMAACALSYLHGLSLYQIEYAGEVAMEHFLGLTCDPVKGYVQIPCIERNGIGAARSYTSYLYAKNIAKLRINKVSFDDVVLTMKNTGESLSSDYKETSEGGLARVVK